MFFSNYDRYQYAISPLLEVICQIRFPAILSIGAKEPVEFQELVRHDFPRFSAQQERPPAKPGTNPAPVTNYSFISEDGTWKLNLTSGFIALSTRRYQRWEDFAQRLDKPLAGFIRIYEPSFFERIGLRYVNAFSRRNMRLEDVPWSDLIAPAFLGPLAEPDVDEKMVTRCTLDTEMALEDCRVRIHAGPGLLGDGKQDPEPKFILDGDFSVSGNLSPERTPGALAILHQNAVRLFRGAITSELHTAMGASPM